MLIDIILLKQKYVKIILNVFLNFIRELYKMNGYFNFVIKFECYL